MRSKSIKLERLLIYSDIYGLNITAAEVTHLETVFAAYKGQSYMQYIYKSATSGYDLVLSFSDSDPYIYIKEHDPQLDKIGYPVVQMYDVYMKFLPQVSDLVYLNTAATWLGERTYDINTQQYIRLVFNSVQEIKDYIITDRIYSMRSDQYHPIDTNVVSMLYKSAGKTPPVLNIKKNEYNGMPAYVSHIIEVLQLPDDTRVAFTVNKRVRSSYYGSSTVELGIQHYIVKVGDPSYNWTDPDRYFSHPDAQTFVPRVFYIDKLPVLPTEKEIVDAHRRGHGVLTLDNTVLETLIKRWMRKQQDLANEKAAIRLLETKIKDKVADLDKNIEFTYNDVTFRKNEFEYEQQVISCQHILMKDILTSFTGNYSEDHLNFDRVFDTWMTQLTAKAMKTVGTISGSIGDVAFSIEHISKKAKDGITSHFYYVNGRRINKDEVSQVVGRAICFPDTTTFDEFCDTVAACSLKYHKYIAGGINIKVHDEIFNQVMEFKISLERQKNKNFIVFNGKRFKVTDTNKLLSITSARGMARVIDMLLDEKVAGMTGDDIKQMMTVGKQALIDHKNREQELLDGTIKMFGIERIEEFTAKNGKLLNGYLVKGGLREYLVDENSLLVYEYPTGRYICMVDKGQNEHTNTARLVNRFFALSNDSRLAKEISTL